MLGHHRVIKGTARRGRCLAAVLGTVLVVGGVAGAIDAVASTPLFSSTAEIAASVGGTSTPDGLNSVSCTSANNCVAVGEYPGSGSGQLPVYADDRNGTWDSVGTALALPGDNNGNNSYPSFNGVSCPSAGDCAAVGQYQSTSGYLGMVAEESGGSWPTQTTAVPPPSNAYSDPTMTLQAVTCTSPGNCMAVGTYYTGAGQYTAQFLVAKQTGGGSWSSTSLSDPPNFTSSPGGANNKLFAVSCSSAGNCSAVGTFLDTSTNQQGLIETQSNGGAWTASAAQAPSGAPADPGLYLRGVSCPSNGNCTAVGYYDDGAVVINEVNGVWQRATEIAGAQFYSISCISFGNCVAVGTLTEKAAFAVESGGTWGSVTTLPPPQNAANNPGASFYGASCTGDNGCTAIGVFNATGGNFEPLASSGTLGTSPPPALQTLTVTTAGSGTVKSSPAGISCPSTCSHGYASGTSVVLTATPAAGSTFEGWTGACSGKGTCDLSMTASRSVGATFKHQVPPAPPEVKKLKAKIDGKQHSAKFTFSATGATGFQCALIKQPKNKHEKSPKPDFKGCSSPKTYKHLKAGKYTFEVRARSSVGTGPASKHTFTI
jgi:hypothetical protein